MPVIERNRKCGGACARISPIQKDLANSLELDPLRTKISHADLCFPVLSSKPFVAFARAEFGRPQKKPVQLLGEALTRSNQTAHRQVCTNVLHETFPFAKYLSKEHQFLDKVLSERLQW
jgi:hypothetical protein